MRPTSMPSTTLAPAVLLASLLIAPACVQLPEEPLIDLGPAFQRDASIAFGLSLDGGTRPPTADPYMGVDCDAPAMHPDGAQAPVLMDGGQLPSMAAELGPDGMPMAGDADAMAPALPTAVGALLITELMPDPAALSDGVGEWIELHNPGERALSLDGCQLLDGDQTRALPAGLGIAAGAHLVLARSDAAGLSPGALVSFTLNNGGDRIALSCGGVEIDVVAYGPDFPLAPGASLALSPDAYDATLNDDPAAWCLGQDPYAGDLGSPGAPNPPCAGAGADGADAGID